MKAVSAEKSFVITSKITALGILATSKFLGFFDSFFFTALLLVVLCYSIVFGLFYNQRLYIYRYGNREGNILRVFIWYTGLDKDFLQKINSQNEETNTYALSLRRPIPVKKDGSLDFPDISARAAYVVDKRSGFVFYSKGASDRLYPASTAKLATAIAALPMYSRKSYIKIPQFCTDLEGTKVGLVAGYEYKVEDLYYALLVSSAADAACAISVGKTSYADFVRNMNNVMYELKAKDTKFSNPVGLDDIEGENYTTVSDLYLLAKKATEDQFLKSVVASKEYVFKDKDAKSEIKIYSTNRLLWEIPGSVGIKTGTTTGAGEVLVYEYNPSPEVDVVIVVMNSRDRFYDTRRILEWVLSSYSFGVTSVSIGST